MSLSAFNAVVLDQSGRLSTQHIEAASPEHAREIATRRGCTVLECEAQGASKRSHAFAAKFWPGAASAIDTVTFSQDLSTLMEAGVTVKEAVDALARKEASASRRHVLSQLNASVSEGLSFSAALEQARAFPELLVATVAASEQTGDLAVGLSRYARHQQSLRSVRDRLIGACVYPLLLLAVGSLVIVVLLGLVVPRFSKLIDGSGRELPLLSQWLMSWGQFVDAQPVVLMVMLAALAAGVGWLISCWKQPDVRKRWLEKLPGVAKVVREFQHLQMYRTAAILTSRGITIHKALAHTMDLLSPSDRVRLEAGLIRMREGATISSALSTAGLSDVVATSMLSVAERSGALPEMLDRIADFYERSLQRNIDIASRLIEPLLMIIFGIVIGGIVVLMYLPIFDLASSIS
ncbi:MAG: type II secretion system F family protein [Ramlibacter sp.]